MATNQAWVDATRAEALTTVYLTRRADLDVIPVARYERNPDYDFLVQVNRPELPIKPEFGVEAKGTRTSFRDGRRLLVVHHAQSETLSSGIPVCLFVFNVKTEEGVFRWLLEPIVNENRQPALRSSADIRPDDGVNRNGSNKHLDSYELLDNDAVDRIVQRVVDWTAAKYYARTLNISDT